MSQVDVDHAGGGEGTRAETWPLVVPEAPSPDAVTDALDVRGLRLLVVDDSLDMRVYLKEVLSDSYEVVSVADGRAALEELRRRRPAAVLTDAMMPGENGVALVSAIRADPDLVGLPVIMLSAQAGAKAAVSAMDGGADDYITKPFSLLELRSRLAANIARAQARSADAAWRRAITASLQDPMFISDPDGQVIEVNAAFTHLLGWTLADGPLRPPYPWWPDQLDHPAEFERLRAAHEAISDHDPMTGDFLLRRRDGTLRWASYWGVTVRTPEYGRTAVLKVLRDVTREHDSQQRRATAPRVAAGFEGATELGDLLAIAVHGFTVLFEGDTIIQLGTDMEALFTPIGVGLLSLPERLRARFPARTDSGADPGGLREGMLLGYGAVPDGRCRAWVEFAFPRRVPIDELIVADMLMGALDVAVRRIEEATSSAAREEHLTRAIESHRFIGQATGILMERHRITPAVAFERLRIASQTRNLKLRDVAERVIRTGEDP